MSSSSGWQPSKEGAERSFRPGISVSGILARGITGAGWLIWIKGAGAWTGAIGLSCNGGICGAGACTGAIRGAGAWIGWAIVGGAVGAFTGWIGGCGVEFGFEGELLPDAVGIVIDACDVSALAFDGCCDAEVAA